MQITHFLVFYLLNDKKVPKMWVVAVVMTIITLVHTVIIIRGIKNGQSKCDYEQYVVEVEMETEIEEKVVISNNTTSLQTAIASMMSTSVSVPDDIEIVSVVQSKKVVRIHVVQREYGINRNRNRYQQSQSEWVQQMQKWIDGSGSDNEYNAIAVVEDVRVVTCKAHYDHQLNSVTTDTNNEIANRDDFPDSLRMAIEMVALSNTTTEEDEDGEEEEEKYADIIESQPSQPVPATTNSLILFHQSHHSKINDNPGVINAFHSP